MATVNLGAIKFNWKGAYNNSTAYVVDDVVSSGGSSYVCILASTGNAVSNGTYWNIMSSAGTNGTDGTNVATTITTQGDILYRDGSGLQRLAKGTANQTLQMNSGATAPNWVTASSNFVNATFLEITGRVTTSSQSSDNVIFSNMGSLVKVNDASTSNIFFSGHFPTVNHGNDCSYHDLRCTHSDGTVVSTYPSIYYMSNASSMNAIQSGSGKLNGLKAGTWTLALVLKSNGNASNGGHTYNPNNASDNNRNPTASDQRSRVSLFEILI